MKQTAVEWLESKLIDIGLDYPISKAKEAFEQAKEMEKQQIIDACYFGSQYLPYESKDKSEQYYNETFKNK